MQDIVTLEMTYSNKITMITAMRVHAVSLANEYKTTGWSFQRREISKIREVFETLGSTHLATFDREVNEALGTRAHWLGNKEVA